MKKRSSAGNGHENEHGSESFTDHRRRICGDRRSADNDIRKHRHGVPAHEGISGIAAVFLILGICFIAAVLFGQHKKSLIVKNGIRYAAKIYGYVENTAYMVNGRFPVNVIVHYFDKNQIEREAVIPTAFEKGASTYPIGMTMDIYEYQGKYGWDPDSVRDEILPGEQELMDDKPVDPSKLRMTAVQCPNCGASYQAAAGYTGRCPYCGSYHNVE